MPSRWKRWDSFALSLGIRLPSTRTIPLRDKDGSIIGLIQTFEGEVVVNGPNPNDRSMKERGWLDSVTGLPNQGMMQSHLREALGTFAEMRIPFGLVGVEVHESVRLRSRYGQEAAKSMLQVLARTLRNSVWTADFVGRWSEDRLLVILGRCNDDEHAYLYVLRVLIVSFLKSTAPIMAVEVARRRFRAPCGHRLRKWRQPCRNQGPADEASAAPEAAAAAAAQ
jgi:diguanylate cyclase (GGDEF)-like protein